jgi:lysophospholipase L1-like esterase
VHRTLGLLLVVAAPALVACGAPSERGASDAGTPPADAGAPADAAPVDAGALDASVSPDGGVDPTPSGPLLYPAGARHSPIPREVGDAMRAIAARAARRDDVLAKIGDSITVSTSFLQCFAGTRVDLGGRDALRATIDHFIAGDAGGSDPFTRVSLAAGVGWTASRAITGDPSPLAQELAAVTPRFAAVMYGTNDVGFVDYDAYARNMAAIVDALVANGTVPLLSSIPPRDDDASADRRVPIYGSLVRALAASRGVPFVDFHGELLPIPDHGLAGDGVHPQASSLGACVLTDAGLQEAANVRNLITLEQLDRARRVVLGGEPALDGDASVTRLRGAGTAADPFVIDALPFAHAIDTRTEGEAAVARWPGCSDADESGREVRFLLQLDAPATITAVVASGTGADLDVHVVPAGSEGAACAARDNREVTIALGAGAWEIVADTFASGGTPRGGPAIVVVHARP